MMDLTKEDREYYVESLKKSAQFIIDNAEDFVNDIDDALTSMDIWISVSNDDVILQHEYSKKIGETETGGSLMRRRSEEYSF